ncbi:MAG: thioredoxin domain-containing protein, partial [Bacteroidetes bacterium]
FVGTEHPSFYNNWCILYLDQVRPPYEVAIVGADWDARRAALQRRFLPHAFFLGGKDEGSLELLKGKLRQGETVIYVCQNKVCKLPVTEPERALALMK